MPIIQIREIFKFRHTSIILRGLAFAFKHGRLKNTEDGHSQG